MPSIITGLANSVLSNAAKEVVVPNNPFKDAPTDLYDLALGPTISNLVNSALFGRARGLGQVFNGTPQSYNVFDKTDEYTRMLIDREALLKQFQQGVVSSGRINR